MRCDDMSSQARFDSMLSLMIMLFYYSLSPVPIFSLFFQYDFFFIFFSFLFPYSDIPGLR
jgi:hypothetical protein